MAKLQLAERVEHTFWRHYKYIEMFENVVDYHWCNKLCLGKIDQWLSEKQTFASKMQLLGTWVNSAKVQITITKTKSRPRPKTTSVLKESPK